MVAKVVWCGQTNKSAHSEPHATWFPCSTQPSVNLSGQLDRTHLLGAITRGDDRLFSPITEYDTAVNAKYITLTL